jgi:deoxyribonuclease-4
MVFIGAHISRESTLIETLNKIKEANGNALQIFASNPRSNKITELNKKFFGDLREINKYIKENNFALVIHNPYTINLSMSPVNGKKQLDLYDCYWIQLVIHELKIAHLCNSIGCIVHCGKYTKYTKEQGLLYMKNAIIYIIENIKTLNLSSKLILETSTGQGTELLSNYNEFLNFYNSFDDEYKTYFKICIDTCHVWAAGYELDEIYNITKNNGNLGDVAVIHINNSKNPKNSKLDRHDIILNKSGYIPLENIIEFSNKMKSYNSEIVLILETPSDNYNNEIEILQ